MSLPPMARVPALVTMALPIWLTPPVVSVAPAPMLTAVATLISASAVRMRSASAETLTALYLFTRPRVQLPVASVKTAVAGTP